MKQTSISIVQYDLINIYHTIDGKEYVTEDQIRKEIYDEIYVNGGKLNLFKIILKLLNCANKIGRVNVISLQSILNVDLTHIEKKVQDINKNDSDLVFFFVVNN